MKTAIRIIDCIVVLILLVLLLAGCGNLSITPGNYTFNLVHISDGVNCRDLKISSWHDSEDPGIEVKTEDGNSLFLSEGTYILAENYCPLCVGDGK